MRVGDVRNWVGSPIDGFDPNPIKQLHKSNYKKKETEKDISLCNLKKKKEVDWVVNDWVLLY